jgi:ribosomal protein S4
VRTERAAPGREAPDAAASLDRQRIDKWLWHVRVVRTRESAAGLVTAGHVRINGAKIRTSAAPVRGGDVVTVALDRSVRVGCTGLRPALAPRYPERWRGAGASKHDLCRRRELH